MLNIKETSKPIYLTATVSSSSPLVRHTKENSKMTDFKDMEFLLIKYQIKPNQSTMSVNGISVKSIIMDKW